MDSNVKKNKFNKTVVAVVSAALCVLLSSTNVFAYSLGANQTADVASSGFYATLVGNSGAQAGKRYKVVFGTDGTAQFGNINNGLFDSLVFDSLLTNATVEEWNGSEFIPIAGNLTGQLQMGYHNVNVNTTANQAAVVGGVGSGSGIALNVNGTIAGENVNFTTNLMPAFMDFTSGAFNGKYDGAVNTFGNNGLVNASLTLDGVKNHLTAWVKGSGPIFFNGVANDFSLTADLHTSLSSSAAVPEPASMLLLSGALGAAGLRRRKAKSVE